MSAQLFNDDCLRAMATLPSASVDLILCDLPYGTTQNSWDSVIPFDALWKQYWRITKPNAAVILTAQCPFDKVLGASCLQHLKYEWIWIKSVASGHLNAKKMPMKNVENVLVFYRNLPTYNPQMRTGFKPYTAVSGRASSNYRPGIEGAVTISNGERYPLQTLEFTRDPDRVHPTQKPVALMEYLIRTYTNPGDVVLDNCMGSGTTAIAASNKGFPVILCEREAEYIADIMGRFGPVGPAIPSSDALARFHAWNAKALELQAFLDSRVRQLA